MPWLRGQLGADGLAATAAFGTAVALALFALARDPATALAASFVAGVSWIAVLATINVSAQVGLPGWVRGRGLALFVTVQFGALTLGGLVWGQVASRAGLPATHIMAAIGLLIALFALRRWKLQTGADVDLNPSLHWPAPVLARNVEGDRGPVLVTVEYR